MGFFLLWLAQDLTSCTSPSMYKNIMNELVFFLVYAYFDSYYLKQTHSLTKCYYRNHLHVINFLLFQFLKFNLHFIFMYISNIKKSSNRNQTTQILHSCVNMHSWITMYCVVWLLMIWFLIFGMQEYLHYEYEKVLIYFT